MNVEILIVDDRKENLLALEAALASPEYKLVRASSGDEALRYLLDHEPALILLDVQMPKLDGFETASIIKSSPRTREIPIIFITASNSDERVVATGYEYGAVDYINKPFDVSILRSKVGVFVDLYNKTQRLIGTERQLRENERKEREFKIAELELRSLKREKLEQKRYRDLVEGIQHGVVWVAVPESMAFSYVSPTVERVLGYSQRQWFDELGFWENHLFSEDRPIFTKAIRNLQDGFQADAIEHRFKKADGSVAWMQTSMRLSAKGDSQENELRGLSVDITSLKEAERSLEANRQNSDFLAKISFVLAETFDYEASLLQIADIVTGNMADACYINVIGDNKRVRSLLHLRDFSGNRRKFTDRDISLEAKESKIQNEIGEEFLSSLSTSSDELEFLSAQKYVSMIEAPLQIRGNTCGTIILLSKAEFTQNQLLLTIDLAARISTALDNAVLYRSAQKAISLRDEFLSIASHELKTPLTPMKLQAQSLLRLLKTKPESVLNPEKLGKSMDVFTRQIDRLTKLIDGLLDISRINVGKLSLNYEEFDICRLVEEVVVRFQEQLANTKTTVQIDAPNTLPVVLDPFRIEQVIVNLITNAIKFAASKPIHISIASDNGRVILKIRDQGIGISTEDQSRIFQRFERAASASHFGGLGLGLYISKQILEAHHGSISVESTPGEGSTFVVDLPTNILRKDVLRLNRESAQTMAANT